jgi:pimeloyl-ACP methyl ester carboxylesterase
MKYTRTTGLVLLLLFAAKGFSRQLPYGNNPAAGKYADAGDTRIYYEVYGSGAPLLLLHGDAFGYIDELSDYIPLLRNKFMVIAIAMRGHGKSGIGTAAFSYRQFAADVVAVMDKEKLDSAAVMGFSAGAITAAYLTAYYPEKITKAVLMGGMLDSAGYKPGLLTKLKEMNGSAIEKKLPPEITARIALMPQAGSYGQLIEKLKTSWLQPVYVERSRAAAIKCPVLIVGGDRDEFIRPQAFTDAYQLIPHSQLFIVPHCGHVGLIQRPDLLSAVMIPFLSEN